MYFITCSVRKVSWRWTDTWTGHSRFFLFSHFSQNFLTLDGSQLLEPAWTRGPYERQVCTKLIYAKLIYAKLNYQQRPLNTYIIFTHKKNTFCCVQVVTEGTPFQTLPVTLPNVNNHAHGVRVSSLDRHAKSFFETGEGGPGGAVSTVCMYVYMYAHAGHSRLFLELGNIF